VLLVGISVPISRNTILAVSFGTEVTMSAKTMTRTTGSLGPKSTADLKAALGVGSTIEEAAFGTIIQ
jgi:hypothetical protein